MPPATHLIRRATFAWRYRDPAAAQRPPPALGELYRAELAPTLERVLDELAPPGVHVAIDRLEVDLGTIDPQRPRQLRARWQAALRRGLRDARFGGSPPASAAERAVASLGHFLALGRLPWDSPAATLAGLAELLDGATATPTPPTPPVRAAWTQVRDLLTRRPTARRRFADQLPDALARIVLQALANVRPVDPLPPDTGGPGVAAAKRDATAPDRALALATVLGPRNVARGDTLPGRPATPHAKGAERASAKTHPADPRAADAGSPEGDQAGQPPPATPTRREPTHGRPFTRANLDDAAPAPPTGAAEREAPALAVDWAEVARAEAAEGIAVGQAGLVLLHPFLASYLRACEALDEAGALAEPARAVQLLHYLATGEAGPPAEAQTVMAKLLAGWPLERPLPALAPLDATARAEGEGLLAAAIAHWGKLGKTTPDGLREGFLRRDGLLRRPPAGGPWRLAVEQRGVDVLLDALPWSLSVVRLPWLPDLLHVDWN